MSNNRPKSIEHIFGYKFYDRVEARKDKLLEKLEKATYLHLMKLLSILPKKHIPCHAINFVCQNKEQKKKIVKSLENFLKQCFVEGSQSKNQVLVSTSYQIQNSTDKKQDLATPYIFVPENNSSVKQMLQDLSEFSQLEDKSWYRHPFRNRVPICISEKESFESY